MAEQDMLKAADIHVRFGGVKALDGVTFELWRGEILGLIGPNGAGKSTLVNVISGFQAPTHGHVDLGSRDVTHWSADRRTRAGVVRSFQAVRLFGTFTVKENLVAAALGVGGSVRSATAKAQEIGEEFDLTHLLDVPASALPGGTERLVGIARALATEPQFLVLDEPAAGLNEDESDLLGQMLVGIRNRRTCGLCVIEHDMRLVMSTCERIHVLDHGRTLAIGAPAEIRSNEQVLQAYLGVA